MPVPNSQFIPPPHLPPLATTSQNNIFFYYYLFIYLIFDCVGSSFLCEGFL